MCLASGENCALEVITYIYTQSVSHMKYFLIVTACMCNSEVKHTAQCHNLEKCLSYMS